MGAQTVVFDTNVLVAELAFPDESADCVALAESGSVTAAISPALLREFAAVLDYGYLPMAAFAAERRARAVERVAEFARIVEPAVGVDVAADPDDDAVVECAVAAAADAVVSDDAHLRDLDGLAGIEVLSRAAFLTRCDGCVPSDAGVASISGTDADRNPER